MGTCCGKSQEKIRHKGYNKRKESEAEGGTTPPRRKPSIQKSSNTSPNAKASGNVWVHKPMTKAAKSGLSKKVICMLRREACERTKKKPPYT